MLSPEQRAELLASIRAETWTHVPEYRANGQAEHTVARPVSEFEAARHRRVLLEATDDFAIPRGPLRLVDKNGARTG